MRLGPYNLALVSCYLVPVWGAEAMRALTSPYSGLTDPVHAGAAIRLRSFLDLGSDGLMQAANGLAAFKLLVVASLLAYLIEFARAVVSDREPDRATVNVVLIFAVAAVAIWIMPALAFDGAAAQHAHVAQLLLVASTLFLITVERHVDEIAAARVAPLVGARTEATTVTGSETPAPHY